MTIHSSNGKIITMQIEDNLSANNAMNNMINSLENRFREVYNCGLKDGYEIGLTEATERICKAVLEGVRGDEK